jgi:hypothetical protein
LENRCLPSTVTTLADAGPGSLRDAIANTPAGGTVAFQPGLTGTITLTSGPLTIDHSLTISGPGANSLTINGNQLSTVVNVSSRVTAALSGLSIVNGRGTTGLTISGGGGINNQGVLTVTACVLRDNEDESDVARAGGAAYGGGIFNAGSLTVVASTLSDNSALFRGRLAARHQFHLKPERGDGSFQWSSRGRDLEQRYPEPL